MPSTSESKTNNLLPTQTEKPLHYTYLKEFRVEQCPLFLQHKCANHKPFTCFYWHFNNQRRRRPLRKRDGSFNYAPDVYCTKYDETTGLCGDGDDCPYLHRTAGDTERRYHLRYYKTGMCVYDTDSRGYCVKNGAHCAFAHGIHDLRTPVYDIRELQAMESGGSSAVSLTDGAVCGSLENSSVGSLIGPNSLDKERNALNDDPRWNDTSYVLSNYKTESCKRPPRLCRQGYACPQYHNNKDKRRTPKKFKYRSTPCPNVKQGDEWNDPSNCESGDQCAYCHTRTEQQFHPEIYKSTKCNDMQQTGYCPRGPFCAFAHNDKELSATRNLNIDNSTDLAALLSNALPPSNASSGNGTNTSVVNTTTTVTSSSPATSSCVVTNHAQYTNSIGNNIAVTRPSQAQIQQDLAKSNNSVASSLPDHFSSGFDSNRFTGTQPVHHHIYKREQTPPTTAVAPGPGPIARPRSYSSSNSNTALPVGQNSLGNNADTLLSSYFKLTPSVEEKTNAVMNGPAAGNKVTRPLFAGTSSPLFGSLTGNDNASNSLSLFGAPGYPTTADTVESVVGSALEDLSLDDIHLEASLEKELGPTSQTNCGVLTDSDSNGVGHNITRNSASILGSTAPVNIPGARLEGRRTTIGNLSSPGASPLTSLAAHTGAPYAASPFARSAINAHGISSSANSSLYDFSGTNLSPSSLTTHGPESASSVVQAAASMLEIQRLREELAINRAKMSNWEDNINQARNACEVWKREAEESNMKKQLAEQQRDEALAKVEGLQRKLEHLTNSYSLSRRAQDLENLPVTQLKQLQQQLRNDLECIDKIPK